MANRSFDREEDEREKEALISIFERAMRLDRAGPFDNMSWVSQVYVWLHWNLWFQRVRPLPSAFSGAITAAVPSEEALKKTQMILGIILTFLGILSWFATYGIKLFK